MPKFPFFPLCRWRAVRPQPFDLQAQYQYRYLRADTCGQNSERVFQIELGKTEDQVRLCGKNDEERRSITKGR
jgi:hypothetical protein